MFHRFILVGVLLLKLDIVSARLGNGSRDILKAQGGNAIARQYVVTCPTSTSSNACKGLATAFAAQNNGQILHHYEHVFNGFAVGGVNENAIQALLANGQIELAEEDQTAKLYGELDGEGFDIESVQGRELSASTSGSQSLPFRTDVDQWALDVSQSFTNHWQNSHGVLSTHFLLCLNITNRELISGT